MGSIPAEALSFYFSLSDLLCFGSVAQWKRVCLLSRRLWVRPPPRSLFLSPSFYLLLFSFIIIIIFFTFITLITLIAIFLSSLFPSSLYFFVSFYSFFILYHKQGWPSGLRRQFKVLFSSEAWVRTPLLAFFLFFLIFFFLSYLFFILLFLGWPLSIVGSAFP